MSSGELEINCMFLPIDNIRHSMSKITKIKWLLARDIMFLSFSVKEAIGKKTDVKVTPFEPITVDLLQDTDYPSGSKL